MKLDGIKRGFLFVLPILFGLCFNSNYTYGVVARLDCARDPGNASRMVDCYDVAIGETIEFTDVDSSIGNGFKFSNTIINDAPIFISTNTLTDYIAYVATFFIGTGYGTVDFQDRGSSYQNHGQYNYIRTGNYAYCTGTTDQRNTCYQRNFTKTYEQAQEWVDGLTLSGYTFILQNRLNGGFYANTFTYQICATYIDSDRYLCINVPHANGNAGAQCASNNQCNYYTTTKTTAGIDASFIANLGPTISPFYVPENTQNGYYDSLTVMGGAEQIYNAYVLEGYERAMCYGGYPLTDIVDTTNGIDLSGFKSGTGASLNEIYEATSGGMSKVDRYNSNFAYFTYAYRSNDYNIFNGDPYALLGLMSIKQVIKPGASASSVIAFCDLVQNGVRSGSAIDLINESVENLQYQQLIGEIGVNVPSSGSAIDLMVKSLQDQGYLTGFSFKSVFSGTEEESITTIKSRWDELYEKISGGLSVASGYNGILPGYIAMGFLAFLLLYLFKK